MVGCIKMGADNTGHFTARIHQLGMLDFEAIFDDCGLSRGRCFGSKGDYLREYPYSIFIANACVCSASQRLWGGDIDLCTADASRLMMVAVQLQQKLYVLREQIREPSAETIAKYAEFIVTSRSVEITANGTIFIPKRLGSRVLVSSRRHS